MSDKRYTVRKVRVRQLGAIEREILEELSLGDLLHDFLLSNRSMSRVFKLASERANYRYRRKLALERLKQFNYIRAQGDRLTITDNGKNALGNAIDKNLKLLEITKWDHKWRIAAFDIPETHAPLRNKVRNILKKAGFAQLQQSIWIFPHECEELVQLIKIESQLSKYILYGVLERIEGEHRLKKLFELK